MTANTTIESIDLKFSMARDAELRGDKAGGTSYVAGQNCERIVRDDAGGWWIFVTPLVSFWQPDDHVQCASAKLDRYSGDVGSLGEKVDDGFKCVRCGKVCPTAHGLKIHAGSHRE